LRRIETVYSKVELWIQCNAVFYEVFLVRLLLD